MQVARIPLVGGANQRDLNALTNISKDQMFTGTLFQVIKNEVTGKTTVYVNKRPGFTRATVASGQVGSAISQDGLTLVYGGQNVYYNGGSRSSGALHASLVIYGITKVRINGEDFYMISAGGFGYYLPVNATSVSLTFTANTANTSPILSSVSSTSGLYIGQALSGTGIPAGARIQSIDSATQVTMTANATATNNTVTITRTDVAKILDTDFPTAIGAFAEMDGYLFIMDATNPKRIYNSDLNSVTSWSASSYLTANMRPDASVGLVRHKNYIAAFGSASIEFFENAGNATGSPLRRVPALFKGFGANSGSLHFRQTIAQMGDITVFSARPGDGYSRGFGIWAITDDGFKKISTPPIDNIINQADGDTASSGIDVFTIGGGTYARVVKGGPPGANGYDLMYHFETGVWCDSGLPSGTSNCWRLSNNLYAIDTISTGGQIYLFDFTLYVDTADNGSTLTYSMEIRTSKVDLDTERRKFIKSIKLIADEQASGTATLEASDDDYASWSTLGTFDMTAHEKKIAPCGSHVGGRAYRLTHSAATPFRGEALEIEYSVGTH
jgi:hypothetical protein